MVEPEDLRDDLIAADADAAEQRRDAIAALACREGGEVDVETFADGFPGVDYFVNTRDARYRPIAGLSLATVIGYAIIRALAKFVVDAARIDPTQQN